MSFTVHVVFNAHLDPAWLWPWQSGLDEALATCRSACHRLDANPDIFFTRGEAWVYRQIEELDPDLFARIRAHVASGRWELVGGWWIQPDCNLPNGFAMERQIGMGLDYFRKAFAVAPRTGYNVDSFGHAATLPGLMRAAGQDRYVMMRPQQHEMGLPARLFRWRGYAGGPEVTTFRISRSYSHRTLTTETIQAACTMLPEGVRHTMLFAGVGDHGGGPSEALITWCREHRDAIPGCRLEFSTVERFFEAVVPRQELLPLVTGELQMHAVGCYSVHRPLKTALKRAEHRLAQADSALAEREPDPASSSMLERAWEDVCFNQFHDILGGTCTPSAFPQLEDQVAGAASVADGVLQRELRRRYAQLGPDTLQRIVAWNASDSPCDGYVEFEPWLDWRPDRFALLDEKGQPMAWQRLQHEAAFVSAPRVLFRLNAEPGEIRQFRLAPDTVVPPREEPAGVVGGGISAGHIHCDGRQAVFGSAPAIEPWFDLIEDGSDTWSHGIDRYPEGPLVGSATWSNPVVVDAGPLMASLVIDGTIGSSDLQAEWRVYADQPFCELCLRVHWMERRKLLKMRIPLSSPATAVRLDGIMGGALQRPNEGREAPLRDWTRIELASGAVLGVVCPDVYALDAQCHRLRLTLLRSCIMAHHEPHRGHAPREVFSDQGVHTFRFRFFLSDSLQPGMLEAQAAMLNRPPVFGDLTAGMATHRQ